MSTTKLHKPTWRIRIITTLIAWAIAFLIVFTMLSLFGRQLEALPHAVSALLFTGILVPIMGNVVMPSVGKLVVKLTK
jgi:antibiotic biosynthesis monooxygenase (ABM) superfamily enzyme